MVSPIIFQDQSGLAQGISQAGGALAQALKERGIEKRKEQQRTQYGSVLSDVLGQLGPNSSPIEVTQAFSSAMSQGVPIDVIKDFTVLQSTLQKSQAGRPPGPDQIMTMSNLFKKFGMPEDIAQRNAELWAQLTTGGQTEMAKLLVDQISRSQFSQNQENPMLGFEPIGEETIVSEKEIEEFKFPKVDIFENRTPKEKVALKTELLKENNKELKDINEKSRKLDQEIMRYDQLERLNNSGKLPENFGRLNVNWTTGDIRVPFLANPETQQFVKTINDFTVAAKDTFGARVTNFELGAFMKRLPTLANSTEGRRLILAQMKSMKDLDKLYDDSIKKVYNKYGVQNIDKSNVERIAAELRKDDEEKLRKDFENSVKAQEVYDARSRAPEGKVPAISPDGRVVYIWRNQADKAEKQGFRIQ